MELRQPTFQQRTSIMEVLCWKVGCRWSFSVFFKIIFIQPT